MYYLREEVKGIQKIFCRTYLIHISSNWGGSSGKEADSEGVEVYDKRHERNCKYNGNIQPFHVWAGERNIWC